MRPSADQFGVRVGASTVCVTCTHGWVVLDEGCSPRERDAIWSATYAEALDSVTLEEEDGQRRTAALGLDAIERHVARGVLLDVGCWTGSFLEAAHARGWRASGVEPSRWAATYARTRGLDVRQGTVADIELADGSVDAVVFADVLEHLFDPLAALQEARRVIGDGGAVLVTVPDAGSVIARMLGRRWWSVLPMHVQYFTKQSMTALFERAGFRVVEQSTHPKTFTVRYYAGRLGAFVPVTRPILERATRGAFGDRLVAPNFGDRMMMVGRR
jgi:SAM-dependent methyltransferase